MMALDLEAVKKRWGYANDVACSEAEEGVWCAALARSCADVPALVAEVERLRESNDLLRSALTAVRTGW